MCFQFLLLHHAGPFENLSEAKIHQGLWQGAAMSNLHSRSTLINSSEALEKSRRGEIKIHSEREGYRIYKANQPLMGNSLATKTLHQLHPRHGVLTNL